MRLLGVVVAVYILVVMMCLMVRPALMFDGVGKPKPFGVGFADGQSVFAPAAMFPILGLLIYIAAAWVRMAV